MHALPRSHHFGRVGLAPVCAGVALSLACSAIPCTDAYAVTAAEKQAEADAVYAQIDSLQTSLNEAIETYEKAQASYKEACASRDKASKKIEEQTELIDTLQEDLEQYAIGMYKQGGSGRFLDVVLESESFHDFLTSWDACNSIASEASGKLERAQTARKKLEKAEQAYQAKSEQAEADIAEADAAKERIEQTQEALRTQAQQLSKEAAELQVQEELAAEAARQAEEARKIREAQIAAAAQAAQEEASAQAEAQALAEAEGEQFDESDYEDEYEDEYEYEEGEEAYDDDEYVDGDDEDYVEVEAEGTYEIEPIEQTSPAVLGPGYFTNPCPTASSSSGFGYRTFDNSFHQGIDMAAPEGTAYYAADSGTVMYATNDGGYNGGAGNWVVIAHGNGIVTKYMHSSATYVVPGDYVERGQNIGAVGNTGQSFGAHLHFQVEVNGVAVNPLNYL